MFLLKKILNVVFADLDMKKIAIIAGGGNLPKIIFDSLKKREIKILIIGIKKDSYNLFLFIPILMCLAFLSKQTPSAYGLIGLLFIFSIYIFYNFNKFLISTSVSEINFSYFISKTKPGNKSFQ